MPVFRHSNVNQMYSNLGISMLRHSLAIIRGWMQGCRSKEQNIQPLFLLIQLYVRLVIQLHPDEEYIWFWSAAASSSTQYLKKYLVFFKLCRHVVGWRSGSHQISRKIVPNLKHCCTVMPKIRAASDTWSCHYDNSKIFGWCFRDFADKF